IDDDVGRAYSRDGGETDLVAAGGAGRQYEVEHEVTALTRLQRGEERDDRAVPLSADPQGPQVIQPCRMSDRRSRGQVHAYQAAIVAGCQPRRDRPEYVRRPAVDRYGVRHPHLDLAMSHLADGPIP